MQRTYLAIDLNNAEKIVMPILILKAIKHSEIFQNIGITNQIKP